jgi:hypothetical protein
MTDGRVYAELQPLPLEHPTADRRYELALRASQQPSTKITLFIARQSANEVIIEGWLERALLRDHSDVESFLKKIASSPDTAASIERLILVSLEASRHGKN